VQYADAIEEAKWKVTFRSDLLGQKMMVVFLDIYGNEARVLIDAKDFGSAKKASKKTREAPTKKTITKKATRKKNAKKKVTRKKTVKKGVRK